MFNQEDITVANKTSRNNGAVGRGAITPRWVRNWVNAVYEKADTMILDFGAGKAAAHAQAMLADGFMCTAYEFGDNVDKRFHNELALMQKYHIVYASNVLNVQSGFAMTRETLKQIADVLLDDGDFIANYPASPRKSDMTTGEMAQLLSEQFSTVSRVGGTPSAPLWLCGK
jgi:hypothetical protein